MKIAVEGCAHGELDTIYNTIKFLEEKEDFKVDLLICCGDFQAARNEEDLRCMAVPPKYCNIRTFYKYYNGEKVAPVLTIFIGGNHEASNYLQELPYGGWVAPNIYYLGYAGVIDIAGVRISGLSGIYKASDYMKGHFEHTPYTDSSKRSVYHIRNLEVFRMKQLSEPLNIFLSHDWPGGIWEYGNKEQLIRFKPYFEEDIRSGQLGSKPTEELLHHLKPEYCFSAHLHCKFAAIVPHACGKTTKFLALDKCLPKRRFLQIVDIPHDLNKTIDICYDLEWLTVLRLTNHLLSVKHINNYLPSPNGNEKWCFTPTDEDKQLTLSQFGDLLVPNNFVKTAEGYTNQVTMKDYLTQPQAVSNPQTRLFCQKLEVDDPLSIILNLDVACGICESTTDLDDDAFIDNSALSSGLVTKRSTLNLPQPTNNQTEKREENCKVNENSSLCLTEEPAFEVVQDELEEYSSKDCEATSFKKFKRRNASIYDNQD